MEADVKELLADLGKLTEAAGRMLQRRPELTLDDLTRLQSTLKFASSAIKHIKQIEVRRQS